MGPDGLDQRGEDLDDAEDGEVDVAADDAGSDAFHLNKNPIKLSRFANGTLFCHFRNT